MDAKKKKNHSVSFHEPSRGIAVTTRRRVEVRRRRRRRWWWWWRRRIPLDFKIRRILLPAHASVHRLEARKEGAYR